jgi:MarR family transcriptional regulator, organic hydroperoxide resistance regulator
MADLRRVFSDVGQVQARLVAAVDLCLRSDFGLSLVLFESMTVIAEAERCRVHDLAAGLGVSAGGASKLVDRLGAFGYCRRLPNPSDRRSSLLELTPAGQRILAEARRSVDGELECLLGGVLSPAQIRQLSATLKDLRFSSSALPLPADGQRWVLSRSTPSASLTVVDQGELPEGA